MDMGQKWTAAGPNALSSQLLSGLNTERKKGCNLMRLCTFLHCVKYKLDYLVRNRNRILLSVNVGLDQGDIP